jgi:hypothetical protein
MKLSIFTFQKSWHGHPFLWSFNTLIVFAIKAGTVTLASFYYAESKYYSKKSEKLAKAGTTKAGTASLACFFVLCINMLSATAILFSNSPHKFIQLNQQFKKLARGPYPTDRKKGVPGWHRPPSSTVRTAYFPYCK